jgi:cell division protein FtsL
MSYQKFIVFLIGASLNIGAIAVTNQELMDRLDDIESSQQTREMNRLMDEYMRVMLEAPSKTQERTVIKKAEGNYKKLRDGEVLRWINDKPCFVSWGNEVKRISNAVPNSKFKEISQEKTLISIVYFPNYVSDETIKSLLNKDGFFKLKRLCSQ